MSPALPSSLRAALLAAAVALGPTGPAAAGDDDTLPAPVLPKYQQECASCHLAYPPGLLPAASWRRLMADLPHHFGVDASLEPETLKELSAWLEANAAGFRKARREPGPPDDRITKSAWWVREHDEVAPATWKLPAVKSPSNCAACHRAAERGNFDEHDIRIPR
jgi:hypothetical protein